MTQYIIAVWYNILSFIQISWAFGGVLEAILALVVMTNIHDDNAWRWLLGSSTLPVLTVMVLYPVSGCLYCKIVIFGRLPMEKVTINYHTHK